MQTQIETEMLFLFYFWCKQEFVSYSRFRRFIASPPTTNAFLGVGFLFNS